MCVDCSRIVSDLSKFPLPLSRRAFGLGLGASAALPGLLSLGGLFACTEVQAQSQRSPAIRKLHASIDADAPRLIEIFKDIHANPELGFTETRTAGIVERELKANGFRVRSGIAKTGVVGVMEMAPVRS